MILLLWSFVVSCATEQKEIRPAFIPQEKSDAPVWNVGDYWRFVYSDKKEWQYKVIKIEEDLYIIEDLYGIDKPCFDKKTLLMVAYINPGGRKIKTGTPSIFYFDFPIYIGKKWKKMMSTIPLRGSTEVNYLNEYQVISYEDVVVPAGTFKAFKIEIKQTNYTISAFGKVHIWYSPEVKSIIKVMYETAMYWVGTRDWELISFKLEEMKQKFSNPEIKSPPPGVEIFEKPQLMKGYTWILQTDKGKFIWKVDNADESGVILRQGENGL